MLDKLASINRSAWFWGGLIFVCIALELGALYYQYVLDYLPCVLCIHIRIWVVAIMFAAIIGFFLRKSRPGLIIANLLILTATLGMVERSYIVLGTERGWVDGSCGDLVTGLPSWFALDKWVPAMFEPLESCGLTPWVIPQFMSMAEVLMLFAVALLLLMTIFTLGSFFYSKPGVGGHDHRTDPEY